jgi:GNAT superfamily N-acetyltransferase
MEIRNVLKPGDVGYIIYLHGTLYAQEYGLDHTFEGEVALKMEEFTKAFNPAKDFVAIAEDDDQIVGSIFIMGLPNQTAQLRWFLLHPKARGQRLGKKLLDEAINFCRDRGFKSVCLWTISELTTAAHLYRTAGFTLTTENTREMWGGPRTEQRYDLILD